jgi:hypothetical protein
MATQLETRPLRFLSTIVVALVCIRANAALIDFETTPSGGIPTDDLTLSSATPYVFPGLGISFGIDSNSDGAVDTNAVFEHAGLDPFEPPNGGFSGSSGTDTADPGFGAQLGNFFLRGPTGGADFGLFVITYSARPSSPQPVVRFGISTAPRNSVGRQRRPKSTRFAPTTAEARSSPRKSRRWAC